VHRKLLRRKTPGFLEALPVGELYASGNTSWHHYAPTEPHAETSSIRTRSGLRNKMVSACEHARLCISTWSITTWTHKINGLTESDFILAAKIDQLYKP
jgi:pterin 4 alpha carbinolamine dehydratase